MENVQTVFKSGFIGIVGPTNSGKSTLMNALVGKKVSIVSAKVQTTYHGVKGIVNTPSEQVIFVDTPGFQGHSDRVAKMLNHVADRNAEGCDMLVWVFDVSNERTMIQVRRLAPKIEKMKAEGKQTVCVLNKVDKVSKPELLPLMAEIHAMGLFSEIIPMSARKGDGVENLKSVLWPKLPEGVAMYPTDKNTDRSEDFQIAESIREKIYEATRQELPYSVWIELEHYAADEGSKTPTVRAIIHVDSDSRKGILIGKGGEMLKRVGTNARRDIEALVGHQICLKLFVDVQKDWKDNANLLNQYLELE